jgi:hypothetical protein
MAYTYYRDGENSMGNVKVEKKTVIQANFDRFSP